MILLSSDYDGTLNVFGYDLGINLSYIRHFMRQGHVFVLNTGREYKRIMPEIVEHNIPYSYLVCTDGNLILNNRNEVIYQSDMQDDINEIIRELRRQFPYISLDPIMYNDKILEYQLVTEKISRELLLALEVICAKHNLCYKTFHIETQFYVYIGRRDITKSTAIERLRQLENIRKCDIYTIGDDMNDLEMLRDFNGYTFPWGRVELKDVTIGECSSVADLVKKIVK